MAHQTALQMGSSQELKDSLTYSDKPEELPAIVTLCQKRDNQIPQRWAIKGALKTAGGVGLANSPRPPIDQNNPAADPAGSVTGYTGPAPMDLSAG